MLWVHLIRDEWEGLIVDILETQKEMEARNEIFFLCPFLRLLVPNIRPSLLSLAHNLA